MGSNQQTDQLSAVSLFTGAGGMDLGMIGAGFSTLWANDFDPVACATYRLNNENTIRCGDVRDFLTEIASFEGADLVHGGPPCQGFSVAGKMDPFDPRSSLIWEYIAVIRKVRPRAFICENVAALGKLEKWKPIRQRMLHEFHEAGYSTSYIIVPAYEYGVPQKRERVFFIGLRDRQMPNDLRPYFDAVKKKAPKVREILLKLGRPGSLNNQGVCNARITFAQNPVMRKSPYAGMMFNGLGRPLNLDDYSATMHASMGGNKTPFVDDLALYGGETCWVVDYHKRLMEGQEPFSIDSAPSRLRRITVSEAKAIQTFPLSYNFIGGISAQFRQIGNAVPCKLAEAVGKVVRKLLVNSERELSANSLPGELKLF